MIYPYGRGPFRLVHQELHINRAEASKREIIIKAMTRARKLALIQGVPQNEKDLVHF